MTFSSAKLEQKHVTERWRLSIDGEANVAFELGEVSSPTSGKLASDQVWAQATAAAAAAYLWRTTYPLPEDAAEISRAEVGQTLAPLCFMEPADFDRQVHVDGATVRGPYPVYFTVRGGNVEFYPGASDGYQVVLLTYRRKAPRYESSAAGDTAADWPEAMRDLLEAAISLLASKTQGANSPISYAIAMADYQETLKLAKAEDSNVVSQSGPMTLGRPRPFRGPSATITDAPGF